MEKYPWEVGSWENAFGKVPIVCLTSLYNAFEYSTVVSDYINTMKTTFDFNFDFYKAVKQHAADTHKHKNKEKMLKKDLFDYLCTL